MRRMHRQHHQQQEGIREPLPLRESSGCFFSFEFELFPQSLCARRFEPGSREPLHPSHPSHPIGLRHGCPHGAVPLLHPPSRDDSTDQNGNCNRNHGRHGRHGRRALGHPKNLGLHEGSIRTALTRVSPFGFRYCPFPWPPWLPWFIQPFRSSCIAARLVHPSFLAKPV